MNDAKETTSTDWAGVILAFLNEKKDSEEEAYLKKLLQTVVTPAFANKKWFGDIDIEARLDTKKNKKTDGQTGLEFQRERIEKIKALTTQPDNLDWMGIEAEYQEKLQELSSKYTPSAWISYAASNANSVSFASHVAKLTHSKIDSPSVMDEIKVTRPDMLTTYCLEEMIIDGAVAGNQYAPIFQFLNLEHDGISLIEELKKMESTALKVFSKDDAELKEWNATFRRSTVVEKMSTHSLLKQVYFPLEGDDSSVKDDSKYHLLSVMTSSSMAQAIYERLFSEANAQVRKQHTKSKYSDTPKIAYPRRAKISVTASNHNNASQLNGRRGGRLHLFSSQPPAWTRQILPPVKMSSWFDYGIPRYSVKEDVEYLRAYLLRFEQLSLSTRGPERRKWIDKWVETIIDEVLFLAGTIQALPAGWSDDLGIKLKIEHQYFLDPFRADEVFQSSRESSAWQRVVCQDFSRWLNKQLVGKEKEFTPQEEHTKLWAELIEPSLREMNDSHKRSYRSSNIGTDEKIS